LRADKGGTLSLDDRRRELEGRFFAERNEELLRKMRERNQYLKRAEALAAASGITDPKTLQTLLDLNVDAETLTAMALVPLVAVAWADNVLDTSERDAIMKAAADVQNETQMALLESWLAQNPGPELLEAWKGYVSELMSTLDAGSCKKLQTELMDSARSVAGAAGGFLGLGNKISRVEQEVLDDLESCFQA